MSTNNVRMAVRDVKKHIWYEQAHGMAWSDIRVIVNEHLDHNPKLPHDLTHLGSGVTQFGHAFDSTMDCGAIIGAPWP